MRLGLFLIIFESGCTADTRAARKSRSSCVVGHFLLSKLQSLLRSSRIRSGCIRRGMLIMKIIYLGLFSSFTISTPLQLSYLTQPTTDANIDTRRDFTHAVEGTIRPALVRDMATGSDLRNGKRGFGSAPERSTDVLVVHSLNSPAVKPRRAFDLTVIDRRMILRSVAFAAVSNGLRVLLFNLFKVHQILKSSWSRHPPVKSFNITFGSIQLTIFSPTTAIPWDFCEELLRQFTDELNRGFADFRYVVYDSVEFGSIYFIFTLVGLAGHDMWYYGGGAGIPIPPNWIQTFNVHG